MKTYLAEFFEIFDYPAEARKTLLDAYDTLHANEDTAAKWDAMIDEYIANIDCDFSVQLKTCETLIMPTTVSVFTAQLLLFICHSAHLRKMYKEKGIDDRIWYDSMLDLKAKLLECYTVYGVWGSFVASWFPRFFKMTRFALGRLQFETKKFEKKYEKDGIVLDEESIVLNVHSPRTLTPMTPEACDAAFRAAAKFYASELGDTPCTFVCSSWLLFPEHETMLPETSNIRAFLKTFDIIDSGYYGNDSPNLWRLFDTMEKNPNRLPADSTLRRAYLDRMRRGEKLGWGYGVYCPKF